MSLTADIVIDRLRLERDVLVARLAAIDAVLALDPAALAAIVGAVGTQGAPAPSPIRAKRVLKPYRRRPEGSAPAEGTVVRAIYDAVAANPGTGAGGVASHAGLPVMGVTPGLLWLTKRSLVRREGSPGNGKTAAGYRYFPATPA